MRTEPVTARNSPRPPRWVGAYPSVVVVASPKGGVGKTTLALNLAYAFAQIGYSVLLADADPQGAIGLSLSKELFASKGLADFVLRGASLDQVATPTRLPNFKIIPMGTLPQDELPSFNEQMANGRAPARMVRESQSRDLLIVDAPGGLAPATRGLLRSATHVISPIQAEPLASRTLPQLVDTLAELAVSGNKVRLAALVLTMVQDDDPICSEVVTELERNLPREIVISHRVPRSTEFLRASARGVPLGQLSRRPPPLARVFDLIAAELEPRLGLQLQEEEADESLSLLV